jgi:membrane-associated HD superfamily phosphohydrolase
MLHVHFQNAPQSAQFPSEGGFQIFELWDSPPFRRFSVIYYFVIKYAIVVAANTCQQIQPNRRESPLPVCVSVRPSVCLLVSVYTLCIICWPACKSINYFFLRKKEHFFPTLCVHMCAKFICEWNVCVLHSTYCCICMFYIVQKKICMYTDINWILSISTIRHFGHLWQCEGLEMFGIGIPQ